MFRQLFFLFSLALWLVLFGAGLILTSGQDPLAGRWPVLMTLGGVGLAGTLALASLSATLALRYSRPLTELTSFVDRETRSLGDKETSPLGSLSPGLLISLSRFPPELSRLGQAFNHLSERLAVRIAQLEEDRQQLRTILSGMVEGVVALDAEQRILFANERASQLLELPTPSPVGRRLWEVVRQRPLLDVVQRALDRPEPNREEFNWNGNVVRTLTVHAARLPSLMDGPRSGLPPRGAVLVLHDTTELRRLERLRQEFVANVSHELKTPLSVIKANVETLLDGAIDDAEHRGGFLKQIASQGDRLHSLILDLLSLARIESGEELFEFEAIEVENVAGACMDRHRTRAEARNQTLILDPSDPAQGPAVVWVDEEALEQILDNLLDNALKYTPEGGQIRLGWRLEANQVALEVADTGIGIPAADLPRIFERFYRVDKARSRELGGTGLGLSIVKHLVGALHGSVRASSQPGAGTTFTVTLPRADDRNALPRSEALPSGRNRR